MTTGDIKHCEVVTHHAQLGNTGGCLCGFKKYPIKPEGIIVYRCGFCGQMPESCTIDEAPTGEVYCTTEGCAAFSNVVSLQIWNKRPQHESEVVKISLDEPIFVMRAQDALALVPVWTWVDIAEKKNVNDEKLDSATTRAGEMQVFQDKNGNKIPD